MFYKGESAPAQPTSTTQNVNTIPSYLKPYVDTYMKAAAKQTYTYDDKGKVTGLQPYQPYSTDTGDYNALFSPMQQQAQAGAAGLKTPWQFGAGSNMVATAGEGQFDTVDPSYQYGAAGAEFGQNAALIGNEGGLNYGSLAAGMGQDAAAQALQGYSAQKRFTQSATDPNSIQGYMSPYMQNVVAQQQREANRTYDITGTEQGSNAAKAGAFGGSREALMASENERNRNMALAKIQAEGSQNAFQNAQAQQQFGASLGIQGLQAGTGAMQAGVQGIGTGLQGVNTALQGQQQGQQGMQAGLAGINAAQAGYSGVGAAGTQLGQLGAAELGAQTDIIGLQNRLGAEQQAQQQKAYDQAILDYGNAQKYPMEQLADMSNLVRGVPMSNSTSTSYAASPSTMSQYGGLAATVAGGYLASKKEGGIIRDKGYAAGGIVAFNIGGAIEAKFQDMTPEQIEKTLGEATSEQEKKIGNRVLAEKRMANGGIVGYKKEGEVKDKDKTDLPTTDVEYSASEKKQKEKDREKQAEEEALLIMAANNPQPPTAAEPTPPPMDVAPTPTPTPAVAPPMDVAPTPPPAVAPPMDVAPVQAPITVESAMGDYQKALPAAQKEADMTIDQRMAQQQALEDKYLGKDVATADYMKSVMDEKANAPDEARRQMGMRLMEFGANWAGTPGAPLVAGMRALKDTLPGVMEDTKENKKVMKEIDKTIYMLQHATRLEDAGKLEKASAEKEKASAKVMALKTPLVEFAMKRQDQLNEQEYRTETLKLKEKEMNQSAQQHRDTLAQPTTASMAADYMKNATMPKDQGGEGLSNAEAYRNMQRMQHPTTASAASRYSEKYLLDAMKTLETSARAAEETAAIMGTPEARDAARTARASADAARLDAVNYKREQASLLPLDSLDQTSPNKIETPTAQTRVPLSSFQK
jgi:hypothetical protein